MALETHKKDLDRHNKTSRSNKPKLEMVHLTVDELISFNRLQATKDNPSGQYVDPTTGLREYSRLSGIIRIPEIRDLFLSTADIIKKGEDLPKEIADIVEQNAPQADQLPPIPSDTNPEIQKIASVSNKDDTKVALMPTDVIKFLAHINGTEDKDPDFHIPAFGGIFKSFVRVIATAVGAVAGFCIAGPAGGMWGASLGAGAGAYVGNLAGRVATGQSLGGKNSAFKAALPNALYGAAAGAGAHYMGLGAAGAAGAAGAGAPAAGAAGAAAIPAAEVASAAPALATAAPAAAAPTTLLGKMGALASEGYAAAQPYIIPGALIGGGMLLANKGDKQKQQEWEKENTEHKKNMTDVRDYYSRPLNTDLTINPPPRYDPSYGVREKKLKHYKKGGSIDDIKKDMDRLKKYKKGGSVHPYETAIRSIFSKYYNANGGITFDRFKNDLASYGIKENDTELKKLYNYYGQKLTDEKLPAETRAYQEKIKPEIERMKKQHAKESTMNYKKGGVVTAMSLKGTPLKGPGNGQDDAIHQQIPKDTWINDADFVAKMGDGTTDAGHKAIHEFEGFIRKELYPKYKKQLLSQSQKVHKVSCAVANGEHSTPRLLIGALGKGSFEEGAKVMRKIREEVRRDKRCSIKDIPPPAKPLKTYYEKVTGE